MRLNNFQTKIDSIVFKRKIFIKEFSPDGVKLSHNLNRSVSDNEINSIRVHKYLTDTKYVGKVETARYLDKIGLDEKTTLKQLKAEEIQLILEWFNLK